MQFVCEFASETARHAVLELQNYRRGGGGGGGGERKELLETCSNFVAHRPVINDQCVVNNSLLI